MNARPASALAATGLISRHVPDLQSRDFHFVDRIQLMDESWCDGAEPHAVPPTLEAKCDLAERLSAAGERTIAVGLFPDVPHNIAFLQALLRRQRAGRIDAETRFVVLAHMGLALTQTLQVLERCEVPLRSVWVVAIHAVSDLQIRDLFPTVLTKDTSLVWDNAAWARAGDAERRRRNLAWFDHFLGSVPAFAGGGLVVGLLDAFRANQAHLCQVAATVERHGYASVPLVGSDRTTQVPERAPASTYARLSGRTRELRTRWASMAP